MIEKKSKNIKGGARPGAGRKKGSPNIKTAKKVAAIEASGLTPLDYMLSVLRDTEQEPSARMDAAKNAAPYVHARLAAVEVSGDKENPLELIQRIELVALKAHDHSAG